MLPGLRIGIYRNTYLGGVKDMAPLQKDKDLSFNFANQIGFGESHGFIEVVRLYNSLHSTLHLSPFIKAALTLYKISQPITKVEMSLLTLLVRSFLFK